MSFTNCDGTQDTCFVLLYTENTAYNHLKEVEHRWNMSENEALFKIFIIWCDMKIKSIRAASWKLLKGSDRNEQKMWCIDSCRTAVRLSLSLSLRSQMQDATVTLIHLTAFMFFSYQRSNFKLLNQVSSHQHQQISWNISAVMLYHFHFLFFYILFNKLKWNKPNAYNTSINHHKIGQNSFT